MHIEAVVWILVLILLTSQWGLVGAFFGWMRMAVAPTAPTAAPPVVASPRSDGGAVPQFEMSLTDDKFLAEAKLMELSPLDSCHYRVIGQLKTTCSSLSEEQLAKLGVLLFNCQAEVEGRRTYPCTEEMALKECTADMDPDTWNAYHIVSNRARSVCYATRQQHFRRRAETTVNALIATATSQLDAMKDLKVGQQELKELTAASLEKLVQGHSALQEQQGALQEGQNQLETSITSNLQQLGQEKALIAAGQELVARLIQGITQRMENVSEQLKGQGSDLHDGHKAILEDLAEVRGQAQDIYSKMEDNLSGFLKYQNRTARFYAELMGQLERMNGTLGFMLQYLDSMQTRLEERFNLLQSYLSWAGLSLSALWVCVVHAGYFLLAALLLSFLHCPCFTRATLLVTVPLNAAAELNDQPSLDLVGLGLLLVSITLGREWTQNGVSFACEQCNELTMKDDKLASKDMTDFIWSRCLLERCIHFCTDDPCEAVTSPSHLPDLGPPSYSTPRAKSIPGVRRVGPKFTPLKWHWPAAHSWGQYCSNWQVVLEGLSQRHVAAMLDAMGESPGTSPNQSLASNSSATGKRPCQGITKTGHLCRKKAVLGQDYCRIHEGGHTSFNPQ
uniref:Brambleberry n=1 Tax=Scleropages formosus TaxID=113540 RepID=A0A8C9WQP9_SCLFO